MLGKQVFLIAGDRGSCLVLFNMFDLYNSQPGFEFLHYLAIFLASDL